MGRTEMKYRRTAFRDESICVFLILLTFLVSFYISPRIPSALDIAVIILVLLTSLASFIHYLRIKKNETQSSPEVETNTIS
ncbi:MAG: hypothetical protein ACFFF4_15900 [Candidatus Thorarchaeota archaeon]